MKKILLLLITIITLAACSNNTSNDKLIKVSASETPHGQILEFAKPILKEKYNIDLETNIVSDYFIPNKAVDSGDVDANFFQHIPFLEKQIKDFDYQLDQVGKVLIAPIGIYSNKYQNKDEIKENSTIILSNSVADHGRILALLENAGLITLDPKVDKVNATIKDITKNPKNIIFKADVEAAFTNKALQNNEADLVAINSNFALEAGLKPVSDALILEDANNNPYVNILVTKKGHKDDDKIQKLLLVLQSKEVQEYIKKEFKGAIIPAQ